jgi:oligosaccharide repeat unit polymerase
MQLVVSPLVAFPALWILAAGLAQIHLLGIQGPWSGKVWLVIVAAPVMFLVGGLGVRALISRVRLISTRAPPGVRDRRPLLVGLLIVGYAELAHQFASAGAIPLLSGHIDANRVSVHSGALGLLVDALTVAAIVAITTPPKLFSRAGLPDLAIAVVALGGFALAGGRQAIAIAAAGAIARVLYWRNIRLRSAIGFGALGIVLFSLVFYLRTGQEIGESFTNELYRSVVPRGSVVFVPFIPIHFALAMNLAVLAKVIGYFPHMHPYGHGIYDSGALHSILPTGQLGSITSRLTPPFIVSTAVGPLWADGGFVVVVFGCLLIGAVTTAPYAAFRRSGRFSHAVLAGYFVSIALYCLYDDLLTEYKDWVVVAIGLWIVGRRAEVAERAPTPESAAVGNPRQLAWFAVALVAGLAAMWVVVDRATTRTDSYLKHAASTVSTPATRVLSANVTETVLRVPESAVPLLREPLATDVTPGAKPVIWAFSRRGSRVDATPLAVAGGRVTVGSSFEIPAPPSGSATSYDVGSWGRRQIPAVYEFVDRGNSVRIAVVALAQHSRVVVDAVTSLPVLGPGEHRDLFVASGSPATTALLVVDRSAADPRPEVTVYPARYGFRRGTRSATVPRGFSPAEWRALSGAAASAGPDLVFVGSAEHSPEAQLEVHVVLAESDYRTFGAQTALGLTVANARGAEILPGPDKPDGLLYMVELARRKIIELTYL